MIRYPKEFKEQVLKRLLPPNAESVRRVAEETGVSHQTLRNWMQEAHIHDLVQSLLFLSKVFPKLTVFFLNSLQFFLHTPLLDVLSCIGIYAYIAPFLDLRYI